MTTRKVSFKSVAANDEVSVVAEVVGPFAGDHIDPPSPAEVYDLCVNGDYDYPLTQNDRCRLEEEALKQAQADWEMEMMEPEREDMVRAEWEREMREDAFGRRG